MSSEQYFAKLIRSARPASAILIGQSTATRQNYRSRSSSSIFCLVKAWTTLSVLVLYTHTTARFEHHIPTTDQQTLPYRCQFRPSFAGGVFSSRHKYRYKVCCVRICLQARTAPRPFARDTLALQARPWIVSRSSPACRRDPPISLPIARPDIVQTPFLTLLVGLL